MRQDDIEKALIELLKEVQQNTGDIGCEVTPATVPLHDLGFFDSLLALETTVALEEKLHTSWDEDSVFTEKDTTKALSVAEIARRLAAKSGVTA
jgi:acyl carrier protein